MMNMTGNTAVDLANVVERIHVLEGVSTQLFSKLQGTAHFLRDLVDQSAVDNADLLQKIEEVQLDLGKSMGEALGMVRDVKGIVKFGRAHTNHI